jgi:hypothetical protein
MTERLSSSVSQISENDATSIALGFDWEMPTSEAYSQFCDRLSAELKSLEDSFCSFCTPNSILGSLGR